MPRFFLEEAPGELAVLDGEDGRHIARSLRIRIGESLTLCDCRGTDYDGVIETIEGERVSVRIVSSRPCAAESTLQAVLYQALPKLDKFDVVVQKSVELGVARIVPVLSMRCVSRPDAKSLAKKLERWNRIAAEAAKQSGRGILPPVSPALSFEQAVREAEATGGVSLLFYEGGGAPIRTRIGQETLSASLFIGPEGGFDKSEVALARAHGVTPATLGPRILRTETAPIAALAAIMMASGNL